MDAGRAASGIDPGTAPRAAAAGATIFVAASAVFKAGVSIGEAIGRLRASLPEGGVR